MSKEYRSSPTLILWCSFLSVFLFSPCISVSQVHQASEDGVFDDLNDTSLQLDSTFISFEEREEWIRKLYDLAESRLVDSGNEITLDLKDFQHLQPEQFGTIHIYDVESRKSGWVIDVNPITKIEVTETEDGTEETARTRKFQARWKFIEDWNKNDFTDNYASSILATAFEQASSEDPRWHTVQLVSTFIVRVSLGERQRHYRAAVYWLDDKETGDDEAFNLILGDRILNNIESAFVDESEQNLIDLGDGTEGAEASDPSEEVVSGLGFQPLHDPIQVDSCHESFEFFPPKDLPILNDQFIFDNTEHKGEPADSNHQSSLAVRFNCTCDSQCTSRCEAGIERSRCTDFGQLESGLEHSTAFQIAATAANKAFALTQGASCQAMIGCAVKSCRKTLLECDSASITLKIVGASISIGSQVASFNMSLTESMECPPCREVSEPASPIVIDVDGDGLEFTGLENPVSFDIDADGISELISWTVRDADDAFLVLDRDGNGRIESGLELFGNHTKQPAVEEPNGFLALAVYDDPVNGGDQDGLITVEDSIFGSLMLWQDSNRDGISQAKELRSLPAHEVEAIDLNFITARRRDAHGNQLRWASRVRFDNDLRLSAVDVIFLEER